MKHIFSFESSSFDLAEDIANDLLPRFNKMRSEGKSITVEDFEKYMSERKADNKLSQEVMSYLVDKGFDFDIDIIEDEIGEMEPYLAEEFIQNNSDISYINSKMEELFDLAKDSDVNFEWSFGEEKEKTNNLLTEDECELVVKYDNVKFIFDIDELKIIKTIDESIVLNQEVSDINEAMDIIEKDIYNYIGVSEKNINNMIKKFSEFTIEGKTYELNKKKYSKKAWSPDKKDEFRKKVENQLKSFGGFKIKQIGNDFEVSHKGEHILQVMFRDNYVGIKKSNSKFITNFGYDELGKLKEKLTEVVKEAK